MSMSKYEFKLEATSGSVPSDLSDGDPMIGGLIYSRVLPGSSHSSVNDEVPNEIVEMVSEMSSESPSNASSEIAPEVPFIQVVEVPFNECSEEAENASNQQVEMASEMVHYGSEKSRMEK